MDNQMDYIFSVSELVSDDSLQVIDDDKDNIIIAEICRLCGKKSTNYMPIFGKNTHVAEKISRCLPITVSLEDELPSNICKRCFHYLNISYKLIVNSIKVDTLLREKLKGIKRENKSLNAKPLKSESQKIAPKSSVKNIQNSPMICEMCNTLFLDINLFNKHVESVHVKKFACDLCDSTFAESHDLLNHKLQSHSENVVLQNDIKVEKVISQFVPSAPISLLPIVTQTSVEKAKRTQPKSVPNIIRSRSASSAPKYIIPTNKNPIKLIPAQSLNFPNNTQFLSMSTTSPKLVPISPKILSKNITPTVNSNFKLLSTNTSNSSIQILSPPISTSTVQILPKNVIPSTQSSIKIITNPIMSFSNSLPNSMPCQIIPTMSNVAIPMNAKVAIPRITSNLKETKPKRRGGKAKKQQNENVPTLVVTKNNEDDHNYTNNDNDNDSDDSCNLPLQDTPTVLNSTCAYDVQCDICGIGVDDDELLVAHKKIHLPQKMGCKECHQECDSLYDLYMHKKRKHNVYKRVALKFSCEQCGKFFTNSWQWENHEEHKCKKKFPMYPCKYCEMGFSTNHKLKRHLRV